MRAVAICNVALLRTVLFSAEIVCNRARSRALKGAAIMFLSLGSFVRPARIPAQIGRENITRAYLQAAELRQIREPLNSAVGVQDVRRDW